jgi:hypothetical protein
VCVYVCKPQQWSGQGPSRSVAPQKINIIVGTGTFEHFWKYSELYSTYRRSWEISNEENSEFFTAVKLRIEVFRDVTPSCWVSEFHRFEGT